MKMKVTGIYGIEDVKTGNIYVGHSKDIAKRWSNHSSFLKDGVHRYKELQEAYNLDCKRIKYTILEECTKEMLKEREDFWIKYADNIDGWHVINKQKNGGASKSVKDTSNMSRAQTGENNGNARLSVEDVKEIKKLLQKGVKKTELAKQYNVSFSLIHNISTGERWASVEI